MIYGDGGIGKTRLMLEIGLLAEKKGWIVYKVTPRLKDLSQLKNCLTPGNNYLLLFDSIEDHPLFSSDIIEKLEEIAPGALVSAAAKNLSSTSHLLPSLYGSHSHLAASSCTSRAGGCQATSDETPAPLEGLRWCSPSVGRSMLEESQAIDYLCCYYRAAPLFCGASLLLLSKHPAD